MTAPRAHRRRHHGARRLLVGRMLFDDRRADRRDLRDRPRSVQRRSKRDPDAVVPVPDDRREPRQAPARPQHRVLERDQERRRSFRGDEDRAGRAGVRQALRLRRACRPRRRRQRPLPGRPAARRSGRSGGRRQGGERRRGSGVAGRPGRQAGQDRLPGRRPERRLRRPAGPRPERARGARRRPDA